MKYLQKDWLRGLFSLLLAGIAWEMVSVAAGYRNGHRMPGSTWFIIVATSVFYMALSAAAAKKGGKS